MLNSNYIPNVSVVGQGEVNVVGKVEMSVFTFSSGKLVGILNSLIVPDCSVYDNTCMKKSDVLGRKARIYSFL